MFFVNFKNYPQAFENFPKIYQDLETVAQRYSKVSTILVPPPLLVAKVVETVGIPVWTQHFDSVPLGPHTGHLPPKALKMLGVSGGFLNHSEYPSSPEEIGRAVAVAKELSFPVLVFAKSLKALSQTKRFNPDYLAYEPPELIGAGVARGVSVTTAKAEIVKRATKEVHPIPLLIGAGIYKREDIKKGLKLGAVGGVVSSAIITAPSPEKVLDELLSSF